MDERMQVRDKGVKGLRKVADARIEPGIIADYKQEIVQCTRVFEVRIPVLYHLHIEAPVVGYDQNLSDSTRSRR